MDSPANFNEDPRGEALRSRMGLLTESDIAAMLNLDQTTIQGWRTRRKGPAYTRLGKTVFYRMEDVTAWIAENVTRPNTSKPAAA